jgi:ATP-dependent RNA helicase DHX57
MVSSSSESEEEDLVDTSSPTVSLQSTHQKQYTWQRVFLHPSSVNFSATRYESNWLIFLQAQRQVKPNLSFTAAKHRKSTLQNERCIIFDCSMVTPYALLLFGNNLTVSIEKGLLIIDDNIIFNSPARIGSLVRGIRNELDLLLAEKLRNPQLLLTSQSSPILAAIVRLLITNGY